MQRSLFGLLAIAALAGCKPSPAFEPAAAALTQAQAQTDQRAGLASTPREVFRSLPNDDAVQRQIRESEFAVLWPLERLNAPTLVRESAYYSVSGSQDVHLASGETSRATLTVHATRELHNPEPVPNVRAVYNAKVRGHEAFYTRNEEIATVTWIENRVSYAVDVECSTIEDSRCLGRDFVVACANRLVQLSGESVQP
jgi:hypothetical protein